MWARTIFKQTLMVYCVLAIWGMPVWATSVVIDNFETGDIVHTFVVEPFVTPSILQEGLEGSDVLGSKRIVGGRGAHVTLNTDSPDEIDNGLLIEFFEDAPSASRFGLSWPGETGLMKLPFTERELLPADLGSGGQDRVIVRFREAPSVGWFDLFFESVENGQYFAPRVFFRGPGDYVVSYEGWGNEGGLPIATPETFSTATGFSIDIGITGGSFLGTRFLISDIRTASGTEASVPEPAGLWLGGMAIVALVLRRHR